MKANEQLAEAIKGFEAAKAHAETARLHLQQAEADSDAAKMMKAANDEAQQKLESAKADLAKLVRIISNTPKSIDDATFEILKRAAVMTGTMVAFRRAWRHSTPERWREAKRAKKARRHRNRVSRRLRRLDAIAETISAQTAANAAQRAEKKERQQLLRAAEAVEAGKRAKMRARRGL